MTQIQKQTKKKCEIFHDRKGSILLIRYSIQSGELVDITF